MKGLAQIMISLFLFFFYISYVTAAALPPTIPRKYVCQPWMRAPCNYPSRANATFLHHGGGIHLPPNSTHPKPIVHPNDKNISSLVSGNNSFADAVAANPGIQLTNGTKLETLLLPALTNGSEILQGFKGNGGIHYFPNGTRLPLTPHPRHENGSLLQANTTFAEAVAANPGIPMISPFPKLEIKVRPVFKNGSVAQGNTSFADAVGNNSGIFPPGTRLTTPPLPGHENASLSQANTTTTTFADAVASNPGIQFIPNGTHPVIVSDLTARSKVKDYIPPKEEKHLCSLPRDKREYEVGKYCFFHHSKWYTVIGLIWTARDVARCTAEGKHLMTTCDGGVNNKAVASRSTSTSTTKRAWTPQPHIPLDAAKKICAVNPIKDRRRAMIVHCRSFDKWYSHIPLVGPSFEDRKCRKEGNVLLANCGDL